MNLHILPDSKFSETFVKNLLESGGADNNLAVVSTNRPQLSYVSAGVPFAPVYSSRFMRLIGSTQRYEKVFIHLFNPLMCRWVAGNNFNFLGWMTWGTDLYHLPGISRLIYGPQTWKLFTSRHFSASELLFRAKLHLTSWPFHAQAYRKVNGIYTWMSGEYEFACRHLQINAEHKFFFYENQLPYEMLDKVTREPRGTAIEKGANPLLILGNSGTDTNNHVDAISILEEKGVNADLIIPVSYGNTAYTRFLKRHLKDYKLGKIFFLEKFMPFEEYVSLLVKCDGLIMNHLRPQGVGNILMMMYLNKPVYLNDRNFSVPDYNLLGLKWRPLADISNGLAGAAQIPNKEKVLSTFSHSRLIDVYRETFS